MSWAPKQTCLEKIKMPTNCDSFSVDIAAFKEGIIMNKIAHLGG